MWIFGENKWHFFEFMTTYWVLYEQNIIEKMRITQYKIYNGKIIIAMNFSMNYPEKMCMTFFHFYFYSRKLTCQHLLLLVLTLLDFSL